MRIFLIIALLAIGVPMFSQSVSIQGKLVDATNNEPVIAASIGVRNHFAGTITNDEGVFQLNAPKDSDIGITCIGYKDIVLPISKFTSEITVIKLERSEEMLEEIIVSTIPMKDLIKLVIETSQKRFNKPIQLDTYYREFVKQNGAYTKFSDGLLEYHLDGSTKNTTSDLIVSQSRAFQIAKPADEEFDFDSVIGTEKAVEKYYDLKFLKSIASDQKKYDFVLKRFMSEGKEMLKIVWTPKEDADEMLTTGSVTYDPETKLIFAFDAHVDEKHKPLAKTMNILLFRIEIQDIDLDVKYKMSGTNYLLSYNKRYAKMRVWKKNKWNYVLESKTDLLVTNFSKDDKTYDKKAVNKERGLYQSGSKYTFPFWKQSNAIVLTSAEEKIVADLEKSGD
ncbi:MAG: carboxypeptidase-like regulatory domain-containing protein [Flavobacterium sp.]|uniref:carboxypeptidase-like regulatory domain-containing protein n=1 Tax=Flavobacterium sp. TaxID=239 RepID=UPI001205EA33|nr:carboxypeptidase-like regulatory domain-containing protein [Flavobacterium sp.]RZJ68243.1 MAG: carboxypeptidase-like regulatory domain-containing protein [Flavobacterium sp.]